VKFHEAAEQVLRDAKRPMRAKHIYEEIAKRGLAEFGAKDPASIVAQAMRKKSDVPYNRGPVRFRRNEAGEFGLAEWGSGPK
jgi:hypothetical protein